MRTRKLSPKSVFDRHAFLEALENVGVRATSVNAYRVWKYVLMKNKGSYNNEYNTAVVTHGKGNKGDNIATNDVEYDMNHIQQLNKRATVLIDNVEFTWMTSRVKSVHTSNDKSTTKLLIELQDGSEIETVIIRHNTRVTLCVSSQIGCKMACTFCATGTMGLKGNLQASEIVEQVIIASRFEPNIRNIVFMGMGEPLDNYDSVMSAVRTFVDRALFSLSPQRVTISTVGVAHKMRQMVDEMPLLSLALSLHAPTQELREKIVPTAKGWKLPKLMEALDYYLSRTKQPPKALIEYILIGNVNDGDEVARELGRLLKTRPGLLVNLIPYNPTLVDADFVKPTPEQIARFHSILRKEFNVPVTIRTTMGDDIAGACGQLVVEKTVTARKSGGEPVDIEDLNTVTQRNRNPKRKVVRNRKPRMREGESLETTKGNKPNVVWMVTAVAAIVIPVCAVLCTYILQQQQQ